MSSLDSLGEDHGTREALGSATRKNLGVKAQELQDKLYLTAKENSKRRFHALYDKIYREDILRKAWRRVKGADDLVPVQNEGASSEPLIS